MTKNCLDVVLPPRDPGRVSSGVEPVPGGGVQLVAGSPGQLDLGGGKPVHSGQSRVQARNVERSLTTPEERRDGGDIGLVADSKAGCNIREKVTGVQIL